MAERQLVPVRLLRKRSPYNAGEVAGFEPKEAARLVADGSGVLYDPDDPDGTAGTHADEETVAFASEQAAALAVEAGLTVEDFADVAASGKTGYTASDVRAVLEAKQAAAAGE